jgi:hypothetical protein
MTPSDTKAVSVNPVVDCWTGCMLLPPPPPHAATEMPQTMPTTLPNTARFNFMVGPLDVKWRLGREYPAILKWFIPPGNSLVEAELDGFQTFSVPSLRD